MQIQIWACTGGPNQQWTQTSSSTLSQNLTADGIAAVFPEDSTYSAATQACECDDSKAGCYPFLNASL
jgi:hypothetical protein